MPGRLVARLEHFDPSMALLSLKNVSLSFGGKPLLDGVELHIERGDRICLLGVNGTGKSSLLRILAGESNPDSASLTQTRCRVRERICCS